MCTSILMNKKKTIAAFNLDILNMQHRVRTDASGVFIEINDAKEGWMPLFGANDRGDFVGMPTCWPHDMRSNPTGNEENVIMLDIDLLLKKKTLEEIKNIVENKKVASVPGLTFMSQFSDKDGNVLKEVAQTVCPTVVSMVYDVTDKKVYWCENRNFDLISEFCFVC